MAEQLLWFTGNRNPSITEQILNDDGTPHDLTGQTVKFRMRAVGSNTLKVDQAATIVTAAQGTVRYDWQAADVDTPGQYLVWWQVTTLADSKTQDMAEALIEFRGHANLNLYVELEQVKSSLEMTGFSFADQDFKLAIGAASRAVDAATNRRFYLDPDANQVCYYTPDTWTQVVIDDLVVVTSVKVDRTGGNAYTETFVQDTDYVLEPYNAPTNFPARPYESLRIRRLTGKILPYGIEKSVQVTGQFGWSQVPDDVKAATSILATKLLRRVREAPFGIVTVGVDQGVAMRIARTDPDVASLLSAYTRTAPFV